jgi:lipopolysaccharide transport system permease protein
VSLLDEAREAWRYRELLNNLVERELQVRYKNSFLGVIWSLANPIARALILYTVFHFFVPLNVRNYSAYVLAAFFPWTYFLTGILDAGDSVSKQMVLVKKVYFPRELLPIATTIANLRHFFLSLGVLAVYLIVLYGYAFLRPDPVSPPVSPPGEIWMLPILVLMQTLLIAGIALFISALNVFFEDVKFLTAVLLDLLFYAVPIIYFIEQVQNTDRLPAGLRNVIYHIFILNPMTIILVGYRTFLLRTQQAPLGPGSLKTIAINAGFGSPGGIPWLYFWIAFAISFGVFIGGYAFFNHRKWRFVEQM